MKRNAQGPDVEASERCAALSVSIPRSQFLYPSISEKVGVGGGEEKERFKYEGSRSPELGSRSSRAGRAERRQKDAVQTTVLEGAGTAAQRKESPRGGGVGRADGRAPPKPFRTQVDTQILAHPA